MRFPFRGVIVFALTWAMLWLVPAFRVQNQRAWQPDSRDPFEATYLTPEDLHKALRQSPADPFLQEQQLQERWRWDDPQERRRVLAGYDALIARYPNDLALRRNRLRLSAHGSMVPPRYSDKFLPGRKEQTSAFLWLGKDELEGVVAQAKAAQKVAPDEGFFPWIEAMAQWGLGREDDSVAALERASRCSRFNDGSLDEIRQRIAVIKRVRLLDWDDGLLGMWAALFPHLAGMRSLGREVAYSGEARFRAGDRAGAWRRWEVVLRAASALRQSQSSGPASTTIGLLVSEAIEQVAWDIGAQGASGYRFNESAGFGSSRAEAQRRGRESLAAFAAAARRDGHEPLAHWVEREGRTIEARQTQRSGSQTQAFDEQIGWKTFPARLTLQLRWLGARAMLWALVGAGGWLLSLVVSRGGRDSRVAPGTVAALSAFFGALWLGLSALALAQGAGLGTYATIFNLSSDDSTIPVGRSNDWDGWFWWALGLTFVCAALGREWGARRAAKLAFPRPQIRARGFDVWATAGGATWTMALVLSLALWLQSTVGFTSRLDAFAIWGAWAASLGLGFALACRTPKGAPASWPFALGAALALVFFVLTGWALKAEGDALGWVCLSSGVLALGVWLWNARGLWAQQHLWPNIEVGGRVLANVALVLTLAYAAATIALWPAHRDLNERVEHYVQLSEVDWLRAQSK